MIQLDRRSGDFIERLSILLVKGALIGGFVVLFDFKFTLTVFEQVIIVGSGFAAETKGMVLQSMLISGFAAVVGFWLGTTKQGQEQAQSASRIAEAKPAEAAVPGGLTAEKIEVEGENVTVVKTPKP